mgnify:CR=1 FL=1
MSTESEKKGIEASSNHRTTEEFLDIYFNRPIGYAWALLFKKLKVHPNVVTIFSIILGIGAGVMFLLPRYETYPDWYTSIDVGKPL